MPHSIQPITDILKATALPPKLEISIATNTGPRPRPKSSKVFFLLGGAREKWQEVENSEMMENIRRNRNRSRDPSRMSRRAVYSHWNKSNCTKTTMRHGYTLNLFALFCYNAPVAAHSLVRQRPALEHLVRSHSEESP